MTSNDRTAQIVALTNEITSLRAMIAQRENEVPNLRDYGFARRDEFERDVALHHSITAKLNARMQAAGYERAALRTNAGILQ
jgi:septal ring factor EnvC (AmiA/AmiB activator)